MGNRSILNAVTYPQSSVISLGDVVNETGLDMGIIFHDTTVINIETMN